MSAARACRTAISTLSSHGQKTGELPWRPVGKDHAARADWLLLLEPAGRAAESENGRHLPLEHGEDLGRRRRLGEVEALGVSVAELAGDQQLAVALDTLGGHRDPHRLRH